MDDLVRAWNNFLEHEKLAQAMPMQELLKLCIELSKTNAPKFKPYKDRLQTRRAICEVAIRLGMDLTKYKHKGKVAMGRGLLDIWNLKYAEQFGGNYGTTGQKEITRHEAKTKALEAIKEEARQVEDQKP